MPESELAGAKELVDAFRAKLLHAQSVSGDGRGKRAQKRRQPDIGVPDARSEAGPKKRRGRRK